MEEWLNSSAEQWNRSEEDGNLCNSLPDSSSVGNSPNHQEGAVEESEDREGDREVSYLSVIDDDKSDDDSRDSGDDRSNSSDEDV